MKKTLPSKFLVPPPGAERLEHYEPRVNIRRWGQMLLIVPGIATSQLELAAVSSALPVNEYERIPTGTSSVVEQMPEDLMLEFQARH